MIGAAPLKPHGTWPFFVFSRFFYTLWAMQLFNAANGGALILLLCSAGKSVGFQGLECTNDDVLPCSFGGAFDNEKVVTSLFCFFLERDSASPRTPRSLVGKCVA
jgi:hypothetical protein